MMNITRSAAVSGLFYPDEPQILRDTIDTLLSQSAIKEQSTQVKAIIAPHAGYQYSGLTAARVYKQLQTLRDRIQRVVLLGPSHRVAFEGMALTEADFFETPLGQIKVNKDDYPQLLAMENMFVFEQAHVAEHCIEVQLPFLQRILNNFTIIPIVVGIADPHSVSNIIESLWGGDETLFVISSDLSHYQSYESAQQTDNETSRAILDLDFNAIQPNNACGCMAVNGLLNFAHRHPLTVKLIDQCNSGDTAGDKDKVVGYGSYLFEEARC
jgi:AmmeMemoRadiSam system protein B